LKFIENLWGTSDVGVLEDHLVRLMVSAVLANISLLCPGLQIDDFRHVAVVKSEVTHRAIRCSGAEGRED
jgi:hypothetical protein